MSNRALSPILSVLGALLLAFVVGVFSASPFVEREVAHAQTAPELTGLLLEVTGGGLIDDVPEPADFDSKKRSYTARVAEANDTIDVTATFAAGTATINGDNATSDTAVTVDLRVGTNNIAIRLEDGGSRTTYTVRVTRASAGASKDTNLRSLTLSRVTLSPAFDPGKTAYSDTVPNTVLNTVVSATAANSGATIAIRSGDAAITADNFATAGSPVGADNVVQLGAAATAASTNYIAIRVTAADVVTTNTYIVRVTRAAGDAATGANLSNLVLTDVTLSPMFAGATTAYTASVPYATSTTTVTPTVDATDSEAAMTMITSDMDDSIGDDRAVELAVGANVIAVKVEAANAINTKTYTVTVTRASATASADTNLSSLTLSRVTLSPAFDPGKTAYSDTVPNTVLNTVVSATAANSGATIAIRSGDAAITADNFATAGSPVGADNVVQLGAAATAASTNYIAIRVTAADGVNTKTYIVRVTRAAGDAATGANLSNLVLTGVTLSPMFAGATTAYTASVPYATSTTTVTPTVDATDSEAAMTMITSDMDDSIGDDRAVELAVGANVIAVKVEAANAINTKTYTVTVTRASATASSNANLSNLTLSRVTLSPAFDPGKTAYSDTVPNTVSVTTVAAAAADSGAVVDIRHTTTAPASPEDGFTATEFAGASSVGSNNVVALTDDSPGMTYILIMITAADGVNSKMYTVTVTRAAVNASDDASLSALKLDTEDADGEVTTDDITDDLYLNMPFASSRTEYTTTAERSESSIIVLATPADADGAMVMVTSDGDEEVEDFTPTTALTGGEKAFEVELKHGPNVITIKVTAADAVSMMTYTVTVTRTGSGDSSLQSLSLSGITLDPAFSASTTEYMSSETLGSDVTMTTVTAMANHGGASVAISSDKDDEIGDDNVVDLHPGRNVITVMVTSEGRSDTTSYMVTVNVVSNDASLSSLSLMDSDGMAIIDLMPVFASETTDYTAMVANEVAMVTVSATATHSEATASVEGGASLAVGENPITVTVTAEDGTMMTYRVMVERAASNDASLSSLSLTDSGDMAVTLIAGVAAHWNTLDCPEMNDRVGADDQPDDMTSPYCKMYDGLNDAAKAVVDATYEEDPIEGFMSDIDMYYADVANAVDMVTVMAMATHSNAMVSVMYGADDMMATMMDGGGYSVPLMAGENTVKVKVTAEDGTTMMTYMVMVDRAASDSLFDRYDTNGNMVLDKGEILKAIDDYLTHGTISKEQVLELVTLYLSGSN